MNSVCLQDLVDRKKCTATLNLAKLRQPGFVCLTCQDGRLYCRACKHSTHQMASLGLRRFQCESGVQVKSDRDNHNRKGRFCYCDALEQQTGYAVMWQCLACEDWFHVDCIKTDLPWVDDETDGLFVCRLCSERHPFTRCCSGGGGQCVESNTLPSTAISLLLPSDWKPPCGCPACKASLQDIIGGDYLEIEDDDEEEGEGEEGAAGGDDDLDQLDKSAVLRTIDGYNALKVKLCDYLRAMPTGHVVTAEEIRRLFPGQ